MRFVERRTSNFSAVTCLERSDTRLQTCRYRNMPSEWGYNIARLPFTDISIRIGTFTILHSPRISMSILSLICFVYILPLTLVCVSCTLSLSILSFNHPVAGNFCCLHGRSPLLSMCNSSITVVFFCHKYT